MTDTSKPLFYEKIRKQFPEVFQAVEHLGTTLRTTGPLDEKTTQLIQLAAAAANHSEGSVRSHTRRALQAGARPEEITHTLLLLVSTIGFPQSMAAISWAQDILEQESAGR
ncbi:carboxymuconolactone decarboxylase family protein [Desulfobulbus alkaliphilus]|uniref:carboxymuconolactone decarboxylase family protein n=1 Tax=Desulfobulbus alkaliphilus TaxID=869814 RepID=UPI001964FB7E|nr:carboxymuconolactone decarboxylase family protein [Desulfobulbus alkaliphilus]MBM9536318.1 carboxymuconolactone decarboxylase family protein [Desulfobulbus alkaliphilus]